MERQSLNKKHYLPLPVIMLPFCTSSVLHLINITVGWFLWYLQMPMYQRFRTSNPVCVSSCEPGNVASFKTMEDQTCKQECFTD